MKNTPVNTNKEHKSVSGAQIFSVRYDGDDDEEDKYTCICLLLLALNLRFIQA